MFLPNIGYSLVRNRFASFFHQPRRHPATYRMALIKMIKSVFHPPNNFRIGDKNQRIFFARTIGIRNSCRFVGSSFYSATSSPVFGGKINMPPVLAVTSTCSFFTKPVRSRTSRAADIALRAPIADGSSRTSTISNSLWSIHRKHHPSQFL